MKIFFHWLNCAFSKDDIMCGVNFKLQGMKEKV